MQKNDFKIFGEKKKLQREKNPKNMKNAKF